MLVLKKPGSMTMVRIPKCPPSMCNASDNASRAYFDAA